MSAAESIESLRTQCLAAELCASAYPVELTKAAALKLTFLKNLAIAATWFFAVKSL